MAGVENHDAGGHVERLLLIVRNVDEGDAQLLLQAFELLLHLLSQLEIQRAQRLIQQKHLGLENHRPCDGYALPLTAGKLGRHAPLKAGQTDQRKRRHHPLLLLAFADAQHFQAIGDVLKYGHVGKQRIVLEHCIHGPLFGRQPRYIRPVDQNAAGRGALQPRNDAKRGCLSASTGPQQRQKFTRIHIKAQSAQHQALAIILAQSLQAQNGFSHRLSLPSFLQQRTAHPAVRGHGARYRG